MRTILDILYLLAAPFVVVYLLVPSRCFTRRRYRAGIRQKLGRLEARSGRKPCLWVHAVSVGEVRTSLSLLRALREGHPDWDIVVSTSTDTGHDVATAAMTGALEGTRVFYFPFDFSWVVRRALRAIRPQAVLLIELELWPNFLLAARAMGVPVAVANGRLSERSMKRYAGLGSWGRALFSLPKSYAAQNGIYAERFRSLGVPADRIEILGNLKYDARVPEEDASETTLDRLGWTGEGPIFVGGSTHPGEEAALLDTLKQLRPSHPGTRLVIAPRHIERAREVFDEASRSGLGDVLSWSELDRRPRGEPAVPRILVVDTIGELDRFYAIADLVFVGGTLVPHGGQNMLEPARHGKAIIFGPSVQNFEDIAGAFLRANAATQVDRVEQLAEAVVGLLDDSTRRVEMGKRASDAARALQGALERHLEWMSRIFFSSPG